MLCMICRMFVDSCCCSLNFFRIEDFLFVYSFCPTTTTTTTDIVCIKDEWIDNTPDYFIIIIQRDSLNLLITYTILCIRFVKGVFLISIGRSHILSEFFLLLNEWILWFHFAIFFFNHMDKSLRHSSTQCISRIDLVVFIRLV